MPDVTLTAEEVRAILRSTSVFVSTELERKLLQAVAPRKFSDEAWVDEEVFSVGFTGRHYLWLKGGVDRVPVRVTIEEIIR